MSYKIIVTEGVINKQLHVFNSINDRIWSLKSHDSFFKKVANFNLLIKLSSVYYIHNHDDKVLYQYIKKAKQERLIIKNENSTHIQIEYAKRLGDKFFKWSNGDFELYSANETTVHIKLHNKTIGAIEYKITKSNWKVTEDTIEIKLDEKYEKELPIIVLLYVNEFYQNRVGAAL